MRYYYRKKGSHMNTISLHMGNNVDYTLVSNIFIDTFMPHANGEFVKVYLYLLRCVSDRRSHLSISEMADLFNQTEADIMRAIRYWDKVGTLHLEFDAASSELKGITFVTPASSSYSDYTVVSHQPEQTPSPPVTVEIQTQTRQKESYSPTQIQELSSQEDFQLLLYAVGAYLGGTLNTSGAQCIAYLYDTLKFPADLIEFLVEYCVSKGHKSMRYIEKVALSWAQTGITTVKEAKQEISSHNETTYSVMNAFGITNRAPGQRERDFITKWTDVYCFSSDIIIEACNRTLKATHQPSFEYADSILSKWNAANVKTPADIRKSDAEYELLRSKKNQSSVSAPRSTNRFNNFHQRDTDIDSLESALISNNG